MEEDEGRGRGRKEGGFKSSTDEILQTEILKIQRNRRRRAQLPAHALTTADFLLIIDEKLSTNVGSQL